MAYDRNKGVKSIIESLHVNANVLIQNVLKKTVSGYPFPSFNVKNGHITHKNTSNNPDYVYITPYTYPIYGADNDYIGFVHLHQSLQYPMNLEDGAKGIKTKYFFKKEIMELWNVP